MRSMWPRLHQPPPPPATFRRRHQVSTSAPSQLTARHLIPQASQSPGLQDRDASAPRYQVSRSTWNLPFSFTNVPPSWWPDIPNRFRKIGRGRGGWSGCEAPLKSSQCSGIPGSLSHAFLNPYKCVVVVGASVCMYCCSRSGWMKSQSRFALI